MASRVGTADQLQVFCDTMTQKQAVCATKLDHLLEALRSGDAAAVQKQKEYVRIATESANLVADFHAQSIATLQRIRAQATDQKLTELQRIIDLQTSMHEKQITLIKGELQILQQMNDRVQKQVDALEATHTSNVAKITAAKQNLTDLETAKVALRTTEAALEEKISSAASRVDEHFRSTVMTKLPAPMFTPMGLLPVGTPMVPNVPGLVPMPPKHVIQTEIQVFEARQQAVDAQMRAQQQVIDDQVKAQQAMMQAQVNANQQALLHQQQMFQQWLAAQGAGLGGLSPLARQQMYQQWLAAQGGGLGGLPPPAPPGGFFLGGNFRFNC